jgi:hypothetical protein
MVGISKTHHNGLPLPGGEGWGEGEGSVQISTHAHIARSLGQCFRFLNHRWQHWPAILRQRMRRAFLQRPPNRLSNRVLLPSQPRVPKSQHFDAFAAKVGVACEIPRLLFRMTVPAAVQFDIHSRFEAEKIEDEVSKLMLAPKFIRREAPVTKPLPKQSFRPSVILAQSAGNPGEPPQSHGGSRVTVLKAQVQANNGDTSFCQFSSQTKPSKFARRNHPFPLTPEEREPHLAPPSQTKAVSYSDAFSSKPSKRRAEGRVRAISKAHHNQLPLLWGEGWGEGEGIVQVSTKLQIVTGTRGLLRQHHGQPDPLIGRGVSFPLTPALSPEEREQRSAPSGPSSASRQAYALTADRGRERKNTVKSITPHNGLPLPGGEGWGEGEGSVQTSNRSSWSTTPGQFFAILLLFSTTLSTSAAEAELKDLSINGGIEDGKARLVIEAQLHGFSTDKDKFLFSTTLQHVWQISREKHTHTLTATLDVLQGEAKEFPLTITGAGEIKKVTGENLQDWSVRQEKDVRTLVLRPRKTPKPLTQLTVVIVAERELRSWSNPVQPLALAPAQPVLFNGYLKVNVAPELSAQPTNTSGLVPIEPKFLPEALRDDDTSDEAESLAFRFHGSAYLAPMIITLADPEARRVVLRDFQLQGQLDDRTAAFTLTATARVKNPRGASALLLSGAVALAEVERHPDWRLQFDNGRFILVFDKPGDFPLRLKFNAAVRQNAGWSSVDFRVVPAAIQPVTLQGLARDTQFQFAGAARPEGAGNDFKSFLPPDGTVKLSWKESRPEVEGKLFYAAEMLSQITISPGLMRQLALVEGKVMQGELTRVTLLVRGPGNVTSVQGPNLLAWNVEPVPNTADRRLVVQFNQPQRDAFTLQVQMQTELGAFPQPVDAMQLRPEGATRFAGHFRVVNEGAVRLEVLQATGLSQISPDQFPETDLTKTLLATQASQRFAFRFSSADFALRVQADNVLPELSVSQLLAYHLGETDLAIDAEFELDIREAPVREVVLRVPKGFAVARLVAAGLTDYFLREPADEPDAELRLVYGQPISERQVIQLRLERNTPLSQLSWTLPRVEITKTKSTRGHIAVSADAGFRLTPERPSA